MLIGTRYTKGCGHNRIFLRIRDLSDRYYNFQTTLWDADGTSIGTKAFLDEVADADPIDSLYTADIAVPVASVNTIREIVDNQDSLVIGVEVVDGVNSNAAIKTDTLELIDNLAAIMADITEIKGLAQITADVTAGNWEILGTQMIFKDLNNVEIMRFNLIDKFGNPSEHNVFKRVRV